MEKESKEQLMFKASIIERNLQELNEKIGYILQQLADLEEFNKNLKFLDKKQGEEIFASIGRGVYIKYPPSDKDSNLFVNVGSGILIKKTPEETAEIINNQIKSFHEAKISLLAEIEIYKKLMSQSLTEIDADRTNN